MSRRVAFAAAVLLALGGTFAGAQEREEKAERPAKADAKAEARDEARADREGLRSIRGVTATLRIQLVISRYQGEKKTGSLPYSFVVTAGGERVRMRMGVDTPVPNFVNQTVDGMTKLVQQGFSYRNVGTNVDCLARDFGDGRFQLTLSVENSSALAGSEHAGETPATGAPLFRHFETSLNPLLRDGQTIQAIASTDPVTGETVKIDVALTVVK
jgi:hypothetical protein